jgi:hypothetical protein
MKPEFMATRIGPARPEQIGTAMLRRLADLEPQSMSPKTAHKLLELDFSRPDQQRVTLLSEKAQAGTLTLPEQDELEEYIRVADLLAILQSRARRALKDAELAS